MVLKQQEISEILEAHEQYGGDLTEMNKVLPYSESTIIKYLKQNKKKFHHSNIWKHDAETIAKIKKAHGPSNGVARVAARKLKVSYYCVLKYWREAKLPIRKRGGNTRNLEARL